MNTIDAKIAFEIDGLTRHHPDAITIDKFEDDLLRQNSLIHLGWKVFRWTDRELFNEPERVKEQLLFSLKAFRISSRSTNFFRSNAVKHLSYGHIRKKHSRRSPKCVPLARQSDW
ncbi:MAG: DUF559 domain-containing protein [Pirellulaceae bacterium]